MNATAEFSQAFAEGAIATSYEERDFGRALREIMRLADVANQYIAEKKPWEMAKQEGREAELHEVCSTAMTLFRDLTLYLKPVLPKLAEQVEAFLNIPPLAWSDVWAPLPAGHAINDYQHLMTRIDPKKIETMVEENKQSLAPTPEPAPVQTCPTPAERSQGGSCRLAMGAVHQHRRLQQGRPAHRPHRQCRTRRRRRQAAQADARSGQRKPAPCSPASKPLTPRKPWLAASP